MQDVLARPTGGLLLVIAVVLLFSGVSVEATRHQGTSDQGAYVACASLALLLCFSRCKV